MKAQLSQLIAVFTFCFLVNVCAAYAQTPSISFTQVDIVKGDGIDKSTYGAVAPNTTTGGYLVVWTEYVSGVSNNKDIRALLVDSNGTAVGSTIDIAVSSSADSDYPDAAYSIKQDTYLVVYQTDFAIYATLIKSDGTVEKTETIQAPSTSDNYGGARVAYNSNDDEFLVCWERSNTTSFETDVYARRVRAGDLNLYSLVNIATGWDSGGDSMDRSWVDVAYNADRNEYLVVYEHSDPTTYISDIYGKLLPANLSGTTAISEIKIVSDTRHQGQPKIAAGDDEFLVVWEDGANLTPDQIKGRLADGDGTLGTSTLSIGDIANAYDRYPQAAKIPDFGYLVVWSSSSNNWDTWGQYVPEGAAGITANPLSISTNTASVELLYDLACAASGTCLQTQTDSAAGSDVVNGSLFGFSSASSTTTTAPGGSTTTTSAPAGNTAPTAAFSVSPTVGDTSTAFVLEPFASSDAEDPVAALNVTIDWETDGAWDDTIAADTTASHTYLTDGTYTITIEVEDTGGLTDQATQQVKVVSAAGGNTDPAASFSVSPSSGDTATTFTFDASGCSDAEDSASALEVMWDFDGDGMFDTQFSTAKTATHQYPAAGTYDAELVVIDSGGLYDVATQQVVVTGSASSTTTTASGGGTTTSTVSAGGNTAPAAVARIEPPEGDVDTEFEFFAVDSSDAEDPLESLVARWDFESDGTWDTEYAGEPTVFHRYDAPDLYTVTLEVMDTGGLTGQDTVELLVFEPEGWCPFALLLAEDELEILRRFRDEKLIKTKPGKLLIRAYYRTAPRVKAMLEDSPFVQRALRRILVKILPLIERRLG